MDIGFHIRAVLWAKDKSPYRGFMPCGLPSTIGCSSKVPCRVLPTESQNRTQASVLCTLRDTNPDPWADPTCRSTLGFIIYTTGVLESRIGASTFWILPGVWNKIDSGSCRESVEALLRRLDVRSRQPSELELKIATRLFMGLYLVTDIYIYIYRCAPVYIHIYIYKHTYVYIYI